MKKLAMGLMVAGLVGVVAVDDALARGGRGGGGRVGGGAPARGGMQKPSTPSRGPSNGPGAGSHAPGNGPAADINRPGNAGPGSFDRPNGPIQAGQGALQAGQAGQPGNREGMRTGQQSLGEFLGVQDKAQNFNPEQAKQNMQQVAGELQAAYGSGAEPFTPAWYADHPYAFQATHPYADEWLAATSGRLAGWLAVPAAAAGSGGSGGSSGDAGTSEAAAEPASEAPAETASENPAVAEAQGEWMTIGVYGLLSADAKQANRMIHLAVTKEGAVGGSHYDLFSENTEKVAGKVDRTELTLTWTIGDKSSVTFVALLNDFNKPRVPVTVKYANGATAQWELIAAKK